MSLPILQVRWIQAPAAAVMPEDNKVTLTSGKSIGFDYLVVATGVQCDWENVPGLKEALEKGPESGVCSNYREFSLFEALQLITFLSFLSLE